MLHRAEYEKQHVSGIKHCKSKGRGDPCIPLENLSNCLLQTLEKLSE